MSRRMVVFLAIVLILVGGGIGLATFLRPTWLSRPSTKQADSLMLFTIAANKKRIRTEAGFEGHRGFPFRNRTTDAIRVMLEQTDCQCARVLMAIAPPSWKEIADDELLQRAVDKSLVWRQLDPAGEGIEIPAGGNGLIRLTWKPKPDSSGEHLFWAKLLLDDGKTKESRRIEAPVHLIEVVSLRAADDLLGRTVDVGSLSAGQQRTARFICFSESRDHFTISPVSASENTHVLYEMPRPLSEKERKTLAEQTRTVVRSGYHVPVTIRARNGDARLDIGPFQRQLAWKIDILPDYKITAQIDGTIHGEVSFKAPDGKEYVDLGKFPATAAKPVTIILESANRQLRLKLDEQETVQFLKVELLDGEEGTKTEAGKSWRVRIQFREDSNFRGPFPDPNHPPVDSLPHCSVVFFVRHSGESGDEKAPSPRRLFVPVRGNARAF